LRDAELIIFYWLDEKLKQELVAAAQQVFYPFGRPGKIAEASSFEELFCRTEARYACFLDSHEKTYWLFSRARKFWPELRLLVLDAHPDCFNDEQPVNYQNFIYYIIKENIIEPENLLLVGLRNPGAGELEFLEQAGVKYITAFEFFDAPESCLAEVRKFCSRPVYVSLDLDVLSCWTVRWPEPLGLSEREVYKLIKSVLPSIKVLDIAELFPGGSQQEKVYYIKYCWYIVLLLAVKT